jgi:hypothetical protein
MAQILRRPHNPIAPQERALAVFNNAAEFCGHMYLDDPQYRACMEDIIAHWKPPGKREAKPRPTLEELGL